MAASCARLGCLNYSRGFRLAQIGFAARIYTLVSSYHALAIAPFTQIILGQLHYRVSLDGNFIFGQRIAIW